MCSLVISKVDYCNSVLAVISGVLISRLQSVLNAAARLIFATRKSADRITSLLEELNWLKVPERIRFCLCVLAYRCLHGIAPVSLADSLRLATMVEGRRCLRSADTMELLVPATRCKTLGDRAFPVAAARAWNALLSSIRMASIRNFMCFVAS